MTSPIFDGTGRTSEGDSVVSVSQGVAGQRFAFVGTKVISSYKFHLASITTPSDTLTMYLANDNTGNIGSTIADTTVAIAGGSLVVGNNTFVLATPKTLSGGVYWLVAAATGACDVQHHYATLDGYRSYFTVGAGYQYNYVVFMGVWETLAAGAQFFGACDNTGAPSGSNSNEDASIFFWHTYTCPGSGTQHLSSLEALVHSKGATGITIRVAIYDAAGTTLLAQTGNVTVPKDAGDSWVGEAVSLDLAGGTDYILAYAATAGTACSHFVDQTRSQANYRGANYSAGCPSSVGTPDSTFYMYPPRALVGLPSGPVYHMTGDLATQKNAGGGGQTQTLAGGFTPAGLLAKQTGRGLAGGVTSIVGLLVKKTAHVFPGGVTPAGTLVARTGKTFPGGFTPGGTLLRAIGHVFPGSITPSGLLSKGSSHSFPGGFTPSGVLVQVKTRLQALAGGFTPSGIPGWSMKKVHTAGTTPTGLLTKKFATSIPGSMTPSGTLVQVKTKLKTFGGSNVRNWNASYGDNTNWPAPATYDSVNTHNGHGTFKMASQGSSVLDTDYLPVDTSGGLSYLISVWFKSTTYDSGKALGYLMYACYDSDYLLINEWHVVRVAGTDTTLAAALRPGDTTMTLSSSANWVNGTGYYGYMRSATIWGYRNSEGYKYPDYTYSRNTGCERGYEAYANGIDHDGMWLPGGISGNVITLTKPFPSAMGNPDDPNGEWSIGTPISNTYAGGYSYPWSGQVVDSWAYHEGTISGVFTTGVEDYTKFRPGTAYVRVGMLANYDPGSTNVTNFSELNLVASTPSLIPRGRRTAAISVARTGTLSSAGLLGKRALRTFIGSITPSGILTTTSKTPTRGQLSWVDAEFPFLLTRGRVSWGDFECSQVATRGRVSWVDAEVPNTASCGRLSWADYEVPNALTRGQVSWTALQLPGGSDPSERGAHFVGRHRNRGKR